MKKKINIIGSGSHAKSIKDLILKNLKYSFGKFYNKKNYNNLKKQYFIIGVGDISTRTKIIQKTKGKANYVTIIDESANVSRKIKIGPGTLVGKNCILNNNVIIGKHCIINSGSIVEHDCIIGNNVHVGPGSIICGNCKINDNVFIGAGSVIINNRTIGKNVTIGSSSNVLKNITSNNKVFGNPAKKL